MIFFISFQYSIQGTVLEMSEKEEVTIFDKKKMKQNITVADSTSKVTVALFEDLITEVEEKLSFCFENLSSRIFNGNFYLTSTSSTKITRVDDLPFTEASNKLMAADLKEVEGTVEQVMCLERAKFLACNSTIELTPDARTIKCQSCKLKCKVTSIKKMYFFRMNIMDEEGKLHRLVSFQKAMEDFLGSQDKMVLIK